MVTRSKPDPQGYIIGAELIGVPIEECFVFEDSINGLKAARASGATVVGLSTTNPRETVDAMSDITLEGFEGLTVKTLADNRK